MKAGTVHKPHALRALRTAQRQARVRRRPHSDLYTVRQRVKRAYTETKLRTALIENAWIGSIHGEHDGSSQFPVRTHLRRNFAHFLKSLFEFPAQNISLKQGY